MHLRQQSELAIPQDYPYGEEITSTNNDTFKFAQTYRDSQKKVSAWTGRVVLKKALLQKREN